MIPQKWLDQVEWYAREVTMKCSYCKKDITKCRSDARGLCIKSPLSDGKVKRRTKSERESDKKTKP